MPRAERVGPAKFVAALATKLSGTPGGVFAPSLAVSTGVGNLLTAIFPANSPGAITVLGTIAYFVGVVRAPLTAVMILSETTASRGLHHPAVRHRAPRRRGARLGEPDAVVSWPRQAVPCSTAILTGTDNQLVRSTYHPWRRPMFAGNAE